MAKRIKINIAQNGMVRAEVNGIKGKACTDYIKVLEELLEAEAVDSEFTPEYYEHNILENEEYESQIIKNGENLK